MADPRVLLDEDIPLPLAAALRARGHDVVHATEVGLRSWDDPDVLAHAVADRRAVMTHNTGDYQSLAIGYARMGRRHFGLIFATQVPFKLLLARASHLLSERDAESLIDAIAWVTDRRAR